MTDSAELKDRIASTLGFKSGKALPISHCREVLVCLSAHTQALPPGLPPYSTRAMAELDARDWGRRYRPEVVARLGMGPVMHEIREALGAVALGEMAGGVSLLSAHDTSLCALLCALGAYDTPWPIEYAAHVVFELAEEDLQEQSYARVLYNWEPLPLREAEVGVHSGWVKWESFRAKTLCHAMGPAEHAAAAAAVEMGLAAAGSSAATDSLRDVLTGR